MWVDDHRDAARSHPLRRHFRVHSLLAIVPIVCWLASLAFDFASRTADDPAFFTGRSTSLIGIGLLGAGAAAVAGFVDGVAVPSRSRSFRLVMAHSGLMMIAVILYLTAYVLRVSEPVDLPVSTPFVVLSVASALTVVVGVILGVLLAHRRA